MKCENVYKKWVSGEYEILLVFNDDNLQNWLYLCYYSIFYRSFCVSGWFSSKCSDFLSNNEYNTGKARELLVLNLQTFFSRLV